MTEFLVQAFITLFVVVDPPGNAPIFAALTAGMERSQQRRAAIRAVVIAGIILILFTAFGEALLRGLGVSLSAFRIAGGILLLLVAIDMVFARKSGGRGATTEEEAEAEDREDISVFPLAFPLIAGPGTMTSVLLLSGQAGSDMTLLGILFAVLVGILALTLALLLMAGKVAGLLGVTGTNVIGRVLGVILAALAAQYIIDGIQKALLS